MKRILGDAKSQMDQKYVGAFFLALFSIFSSGQNYSMSHPRMIHS